MRWIGYVSQNAFGQSFEVERYPSLAAAKKAYVDYCNAVGTDECSMSLYPYSPEDWAAGKDFADLGCPFDYPSKLIDRGPRNGIVVINA